MEKKQLSNRNLIIVHDHTIDDVHDDFANAMVVQFLILTDAIRAFRHIDLDVFSIDGEHYDVLDSGGALEYPQGDDL